MYIKENNYDTIVGDISQGSAMFSNKHFSNNTLIKNINSPENGNYSGLKLAIKAID
jgi:hypothetical protein